VWEGIMVNTIIFSVGNVLITSGKAYSYLMKETGISEEKLSEVRESIIRPAQKGEITTKEFEEKLCEAYNVDSEELSRLFVEGGKLLEVNEKVLSIVEKLKGNYNIALFSTTTEKYASLTVEKDLYSNFSNVIYSYEIGALKPEIEVYEKILEKLGKKGEECLYIDAKEENLVPAEEVGMKTVLYVDAEELAEKLTKYS
jgi:FMN phosphatase YigB (HAD superfamily)